MGLAGGLSTQGYAFQNPLAYIDPIGEEGILGLTTFESAKRGVSLSVTTYKHNP